MKIHPHVQVVTPQMYKNNEFMMFQEKTGDFCVVIW